MCINGPISLYSINTPSHSASAVSVYNLSLQNLSYENTLNTEKYLINSMEKNNNNTKTIVPTAIVANQNHVNHRTKSIITSDSHNTNQGMLSLFFVNEVNFNFLNNKYLINMFFSILKICIFIMFCLQIIKSIPSNEII